MSFKTKNLTKRLSQRGFHCCILDAPYLLPLTTKTSTLVDGDKEETIITTHGKRENARAWFAYNKSGSLDGLRESLSYTCALLQHIFETHDIDPDNGIIAAGFSQGAVFCHVLASLAAQGHPLFRNLFTKFIFMSGFAAKQSFETIQGLPAIQTLPFSHMQFSDTTQILAGSDERSSDYDRAIQLWERSSNALLIDIPSLHIFGTGDTSVPPSLSHELSSRFITSQRWRHSKGHVIRTNLDCSDAIFNFLQQEILDDEQG